MATWSMKASATKRRARLQKRGTRRSFQEEEFAAGTKQGKSRTLLKPADRVGGMQSGDVAHKRVDFELLREEKKKPKPYFAGGKRVE